MRKKIVASVVCISMILSTAGSSFALGQAEGDQKRTYHTEAKTELGGADQDYDVKLAVELDKNGRISSVKDNGTDAKSDANKNFWQKYITESKAGKGLSSFIGKDEKGVEALKTGNGGADGVSGATVSSEAAKKAVLKAFSKKDKDKAENPDANKEGKPGSEDGKNKAEGDKNKKENSETAPDMSKAEVANIYEGKAVGGGHATLPYPMKVKVSVDKDDRIIEVEDNGTDPTENPESDTSDRDGAYVGIYMRGNGYRHFVGKTLDEVQKMEAIKNGAKYGTPGNAGIHGVTGATACSIASKDAVINALKNKKKWSMPPKKSEKLVAKEHVRYGRGGKETFRHYYACVKVTLDEKDERIVKVEDFYTNPKGDPDAKFQDANTWYWNKFLAGKGLERYKNKTYNEVLQMNVEEGGADSVSGATLSSKMVKASVLNAFNLHPMNFEVCDKIKENSLHGPWENGVSDSAHNYNGSFIATLYNYLPDGYEPEITKVRYGTFDDKKQEMPASIVKIDKQSEGIGDLTIKAIGERKPGYYAIELKDKSGKYSDMNFSLDMQNSKYSYPNFTVEDRKNVFFKNGRARCDSMSIDDINRQIKEIEIFDEKGKLIKNLPLIDGNTNINKDYLDKIYKKHPLLTEDGKINPDLRDESGNKIFASDKVYKIHFHTWNGGGGVDLDNKADGDEFVTYNPKAVYPEEPVKPDPDKLTGEHQLRVDDYSYYYGYDEYFYPDVKAFEDGSGYKVGLKSTLPKSYDLQLVEVTYGMDAQNGEKVKNVSLTKDKKALILQGKLKPGNYFIRFKDGSGKYKTQPAIGKSKAYGIRTEYTPYPFFTIGTKYSRDFYRYISFDDKAYTFRIAKDAMTPENLVDNIYGLELISLKDNSKTVFNVLDKKNSTQTEEWKKNPLFDNKGRLNFDVKLSEGKKLVPGEKYSIKLKAAGNLNNSDDYDDVIYCRFTAPDEKTVKQLKEERAKEDKKAEKDKEQDPKVDNSKNIITKGYRELKTKDGKYYIKLIVEFNPETKKIVSVKDRGTEDAKQGTQFYIDKTSGEFKDKATQAWKLFNEKGGFDKYVGKTFEEAESVEAVSGATLTSGVVKKAVLDSEVNHRIKTNVLTKIDEYSEDDYVGEDKEKFKAFMKKERDKIENQLFEAGLIKRQHQYILWKLSTFTSKKHAENAKKAADEINKIGVVENINAESESAISSARAEFNKLSSPEKKLVKNAENLTKAEAKLFDLKYKDAVTVEEGEHLLENRDFGYKVKVRIYVSDSGKIVKIEDAGTQDEINSNKENYYRKHNTEYFTEDFLPNGGFYNYLGKTKDNFKDVDAISHATLTSNATKEAISNAFKKIEDKKLKAEEEKKKQEDAEKQRKEKEAAEAKAKEKKIAETTALSAIKVELSGKILKDKNIVFEEKKAKGLLIEIDTAFANFDDEYGRVLLNDRALSKDEFEASEGSVIIKIKDKTLNALKPGVHKLKITTKAGYYESSMKVMAANVKAPERKEDDKKNYALKSPEQAKTKSAADTNNSSKIKKVNTGDDSKVILYVTLTAVVALLAASIIIIRRKYIKRHKNCGKR